MLPRTVSQLVVQSSPRSESSEHDSRTVQCVGVHNY